MSKSNATHQNTVVDYAIVAVALLIIAYRALICFAVRSLRITRIVTREATTLADKFTATGRV